MQNQIIEILCNSDDYVSGQEISEQLGVSRQAVWKAITSLKSKGYCFDSVTNKGYKLISFPDFLTEMGVKSRLKNKIIGKNFIVLENVDSTNNYLKALGSQGCENGTVVAAREQVNGKGRLGRAWQSKKDDGIAFSFLLRPDCAPSELSSITPLAGLAVCKAIRSYTGIDCKIKWPNDIIVNNKKLVGILTEMSAEFDTVEYVVTGIGINIRQTSFPEEISKKATSICLETNRNIDVNDFLAFILAQIEQEFLKNNLSLTGEALEEYSTLCATIGRKVSLTRNSVKISGTASGIDSNGELLVTLDDGSICKVNSGEVTVQGIY